MSDRLELRDRLFGESFCVGVVPTGERGRGNATEVSRILNVGEANESCRLLEETFGSVRAGSEGRVVGGEVAVAVLTVKLEGSDDQLDSLGSPREILDSS